MALEKEKERILLLEEEKAKEEKGENFLRKAGEEKEKNPFREAEKENAEKEASPKGEGLLRIGPEEVKRASELLNRYKQGKANLEARIVEDEQWYRLRHWDVIRRRTHKVPGEVRPEPTSAWLFNTLMAKHADAEDNYPQPDVLPRERGDEKDAKALSSILPVILERNGFDQTYSDNWWEKLKHGTAAYAVLWNPTLENGVGDIDIKPIDLLNIFWEPGITELRKSRNLFLVDLIDIDLLERLYPQHKGKLGANVIDVKQYVYDDTADLSGKTLVIDRYYKVRSKEGRTVLHYMKFCGDCLLYASENDGRYAERGYYDHGEYPVVFDTLFPEKGTPVGFGYIAVTKDPQLYIDKLSQSILENVMMCAKPRFFAASSTGVNEQEFLDWSKPIIHVEGNSLEDARLKQLVLSPVSGVCVDILQMKINELKETSSNRDVQNGGSGAGITSGAALSVLQEAGNKTSRDMLSASYRAYTRINYLCIELIRQFYEETRTFRIMGAPGEYRFVDYSNSGIRDQLIPPAYPGEEAEEGYLLRYRRPIFDIKIHPERRSPYSRLSANETAKELYAMGAFSPERATESLVMLDMMDFEGKDSVIEQVQSGKTLLSVCEQMSERIKSLEAALSGLSGQQAASPSLPEAPGGPSETGKRPSGMGARLINAQRKAGESYGERLVKNATPRMDRTQSRTAPGGG